VLKGPKILPSQQLGAAVAPWPGATGLIASVTADDMAHKGESIAMSPKISTSQTHGQNDAGDMHKITCRKSRQVSRIF
jgi:hypothetical protein